jgi:MoxR-like ATPase
MAGTQRSLLGNDANTETTAASKITTLCTPLTETVAAEELAAAVAEIEAGDDPAAVEFRTDVEFFFGLRRQPPKTFTPTDSETAFYMYDPVNEAKFRDVADRENLFLLGPPGSGKTLSAKWFAHEWGANFYLTSFNAHTQADDILGTPVQDPVTRVWKYEISNLVRAYRDGGVWCGDEVAALKPGPAQVLHPFLNGDTVTVMTPDGPVRIPRHQHFRAFLTANHWQHTRGNNIISEALMDRCTIVTMDYISEALETEALLSAVPDAPPGLVEDLVNFAASVRNGVRTNPERYHYLPSTRMLTRLVRHIVRKRSDIATACETMIFQPIKIRFPEEESAIRDTFESFVKV